MAPPSTEARVIDVTILTPPEVWAVTAIISQSVLAQCPSLTRITGTLVTGIQFTELSRCARRAVAVITAPLHKHAYTTILAGVGIAI
jgi:hypothetical protein